MLSGFVVACKRHALIMQRLLSNDCLLCLTVTFVTFAGKSQRAALVFVEEEGANAALQVTCSLWL